MPQVDLQFTDRTLGPIRREAFTSEDGAVALIVQATPCRTNIEVVAWCRGDRTPLPNGKDDVPEEMQAHLLRAAEASRERIILAAGPPVPGALSDTRRAKLEALAAQPGTTAEGAAAQAVLDRHPLPPARPEPRGMLARRLHPLDHHLPEMPS